MKYLSQFAFLLLGIWLIYQGVSALIDLSVIPSFIPAVLAIVAGIGIIMKK